MSATVAVPVGDHRVAEVGENRPEAVDRCGIGLQRYADVHVVAAERHVPFGRSERCEVAVRSDQADPLEHVA